MIFVANNEASEILQPSKQAFDFPSTPITPELSAVLGRRLFASSSVRRDHFNATILHKLLIKTITVIGFIADKFVRCIPGKATVDCFLNELHLMGRSAFHVSGDRKTTSVCDCHDLGAFAALCLADSKTPFFAGAKQPSMKASRISIWPRSYRSSTSSWAMRWKMPSRTHCWNQRWQVWYGGYRWGRSFQGAPVLRIQRIPFITSRGSLGLRPLGSLIGVKDTIMGSIRFHCSFFSSILILLHNQAFMSRFILR